MNTLETNELHKIWLKFLNTTKTDDGEIWLDAFLAKYLSLLCSSDGDASSSFSFQWKSPGNILAHQLISDMYDICEKVKATPFNNDNSSVSEPFKKYLLEGRGWKILWALENIGIQNLLCLKDLIKLLILHVPVLLSLPVCPSTIPASLQRKPKFTSLNASSLLSKHNKSFQHNIDLRFSDNYIPHKKKNFIGKKRFRRKKIKAVEKDFSSTSDEDQVLLEPCTIPASQLISLLKVNWVNSTSVQKSISEVDESDNELSLVDSSSLIEDYRCYNISVIDYMHFILNLFHESTQLDHRNSEYNSSSAALILEFALNTVSDFHSGRYTFDGWAKSSIDSIRNQLLQLVFLSSIVAHSLADYTGAPNGNEVITTLLSISEEMLSCTSDKNTLSFLGNIIQGCLILISNTIETNQGEYAKITCIIKTFYDNCSNLYDDVILSLLKEGGEINIQKSHEIISLVTGIIISLKHIKLSVAREKTDCTTKQQLVHHHSDLLGSFSNYLGINKESECCIASLSCLLLKSFKLPLLKSTFCDIIKQLKICGICCCINPSFVLNALLGRFTSFDLELQHFILMLLEKHLFPQLGLSSKNSVQCSYCSRRLNDSEMLSRSLIHSHDRQVHCSPQIDSLTSSSDLSNSFWNYFNVYNDLLNCPDSESLDNISKHLLHLFNNLADECKWQLFLKVVLPQFLTLSVDHPMPLIKKIKSRCILTILHMVLSNESFFTVFIHFGGIPVLHPFLLVSEFRPLTLNVLKILIFSENKSNDDSDVEDSYTAITLVPASAVFCNFILENTQAFFQRIKLFLSGNVQLNFEDTDTTFFNLDGSIHCLCEVWKSYKEILTTLENSNYFLKMSDKVFEAGYNLLTLLLKNLNTIVSVPDFEDKPDVTKRILFLLQSLLAICLKAQKERSSQVKILEAVKNNLKNYCPKLMEHRILLFDLILRCCLLPMPTSVSPLCLYKSSNSRETVDGETSSDRDITDSPSYNESYTADTEGSCNNVSTRSSTLKYEVMHQSYIEHGDLVKMLLELVLHFQKESTNDWKPSAVYIMQNVIKLCQECDLNKNVLNKQGISTLLLEIFSCTLKLPREDIYEYQKTVLELFVILAEISVKPNDLRNILDFSKSPCAPMHLILKCLNTLVDDMTMQPVWSVCFPCLQKVNYNMRVKKRLMSTYDILQHFASSNGELFGFKHCALCFPIMEDTKWSSFDKGFCVAMWLKCNKMYHFNPTLMTGSNATTYVSQEQASEGDNLFGNEFHWFHLVSVGSDKFLLEIWYNSSENDLILRITSSNKGHVTCLAKGICKSFLQENVWHHLVVNYSEDEHKSVITSRVQIILDGIKENVLNFTFKKPGSNLLNNCHVLLGHSEQHLENLDSISPAYSIGSFKLFKGNILTKDIAFYLASLGPNYMNITECAVQKQTMFVPKINVFQNLPSSVSRAIYLGINPPSLAPLQNSLLCSYTAETVDSYLVYPPISHGFFSLNIKSKLSPSLEGLYHKLPVELQAVALGHVAPSEFLGFEYALQRTGGITNFLFLFAFVVENEGKEQDIAEALNLILKLVNKSTAFAEDFIRIEGYKLLTQMISSSKCTVSDHLFQVLKQNCLAYYTSRDRVKKSSLPNIGKPSIIYNSAVLSLMLNSILIAKNKTLHIQSSLFSLLESLLNPNLVVIFNLGINLKQMKHVQVLSSLFWLLKRQTIMSEKLFPVSVAKMIPPLMKQLLISNFEESVFRSICHFTLLLHNSSSAYVCHSRPAFFFLSIIDKLANKNIDSKSISSSSSLGFIGNDQSFSSQTSFGSFLFKRSSSYSEQYTVSTSTENLRTSAKLKPSASLNALDFFGESKASGDNTSIDEKEFSLGKNKSKNVVNDEESSKMCAGLLEIILYFITPSNSVNFQSCLQFIEPELFIVLANTVHSDVCVLAIKILSSYLKEFNENVQNAFLNIKGFHLLANQLFGPTYNDGIFGACFDFLLQSPLLSVNVSQVYNVKTATTFQIMSWLPLLSLLPGTVTSPDVCEKIISILTKFLQLGPSVIFDLAENGLFISVAQLLVRISESIKFLSSNICKLSPCTRAVCNLLKVISTELCSSKRSKDFFAFCEVLHLFSSMERSCVVEHGPESLSVQLLRECQCIMYTVVVDLSKSYDFPVLGNNSILLHDKTVWELLREFQDSIGTFSTTSAPSSDFDIRTEKEALSTENRAEKIILEIPMTEVVKRFEILMEAAAFFIIFKDPKVKVSLKEQYFIKSFFMFCIKGLVVSMNKKMNISKSESPALMCCLKESFKKELCSLLITLLSPNQDSMVKEFVVEILATHPLNRKILTFVVFSISRIENFVIFLSNLVSNASPNIKKKAIILSNLVHDILKDSSFLASLKINDNNEKLNEEWIQLWVKDRHKWVSEANKLNEKIFAKYENLAQSISIEALKVTKRVFEIQNNERKSFMEDLKIKYYEEASERRSWFKLIEQMTHEKAMWCIFDAYPQSWELDPTEGPLRIRRRLKRCYLNVNSRFLRQEYSDKLVNMTIELPFVNLLQHQNEFPDSAAVLHRLHSHEQIEYTSNCKIVTAFEEARAEILIGACCIHLIGEETYTQNKMCSTSESWPFYSIKEIVPRRYELQNNAFEIFLTNGLTYLIAFNSEREFQYIWRQLESHGLPCQTTTDVLTLTQLWREGSMTNFEYLTLLNKLSGRSFNDLMQYPVFPYVLADYVNQYINLSNPAMFRNLEKPVAIQHTYREKFYKDTYELLKDQSCGPFSEQQLPISGPYHYGSHYSNSGSVLHFLIRLLPYTYSFIKYQDNNFDLPDRSFHSVHTSWQLVTKDSTSDVKELIPEFFYLPEFLMNMNGFDFGVRQSGIRVNDVLLPPWCKQNPRLFILIHRQALESETITTNIHNWIDLVYGYKQTGEAAINAVNVYHPATYFGLDINQWKDPITKKALKAMIKTLGQMPKQLFSAPHPMVSLSLVGLDLTDEDEDAMDAVETVKGIRWGDYVGSPSTGIPSLVWCRKKNIVIGTILPLLANYMFGLGEKICILLNQKKNTESDISRASYIMSAALISWGHKDRIIRITLCRNQPAIPLLSANILDPVCLCASVPDCKELFIAHESGVIEVYSLCLGSHGLSVTLENPPLQLNGHSKAVTSIYICKAFSIFVTTSKDCSIVVWDLNRLSYVRSITDHESIVHLATVSDTLGDIASSSYSNGESCLKVHTINGEKVGSVTIPDIITALCYSTAPEGVSVNSIATGLHSGRILLWSSWDLKPLREITCDRFLLPIKCIVFSADNQHLFASNVNGTVATWEKPSKGLTSVPRLLVFSN